MDLTSSFADCTGARIWVPGRCGVFDMVPDHLQWLLHKQGNKRNPVLTIPWNRRGVTVKTHPHRGHIIFAPLLFWTVPPIYFITVHFILQGRRKQQASSTLCSEADVFLSRIRWKWKWNIWEPTWRISHNTAVNLPLHQGQLNVPHCVSKTKKGSAGPSVLAHPCPSSMPPLPTALLSCPRAHGWALQQKNGLLTDCRQVRIHLLAAPEGSEGVMRLFRCSLGLQTGFVRHGRQSQDSSHVLAVILQLYFHNVWCGL